MCKPLFQPVSHQKARFNTKLNVLFHVKQRIRQIETQKQVFVFKEYLINSETQIAKTAFHRKTKYKIAPKMRFLAILA